MILEPAAWILQLVLLLMLLCGIAAAERRRSIEVLSVRINCPAVCLSNHHCKLLGKPPDSWHGPWHCPLLLLQQQHTIIWRLAVLL
jgi:hypothetical protein